MSTRANQESLEFSLPEEVRSFRPQCRNCSPDVVLDESSRPCSFYDCPGLPPQLEVACDVCVYDFSLDQGTVRCDHDTCETALRLKGNVPTYRAWLRLLAAERNPRPLGPPGHPDGDALARVSSVPEHACE